MTPDAKAALDALVNSVLGDRADRDLLRPTLLSTLRREVDDFVKYHPPEFAEMRVRDFAIWRQHYAGVGVADVGKPGKA